MIGVEWSDITNGYSEKILPEQIAKWYGENPDMEALETTIRDYIHSKHSLPPECVDFVLYEYDPSLDHLRYEFIQCEFPLAEDWYIRRLEGRDVFD